MRISKEETERINAAVRKMIPGAELHVRKDAPKGIQDYGKCTFNGICTEGGPPKEKFDGGGGLLIRAAASNTECASKILDGISAVYFELKT